jgi:hypothetical protein
MTITRARTVGLANSVHPDHHHLRMCPSIAHLQSKWTKVGNVLWWILAASVGVGLIIFYGIVWLYRRFAAGPPTTTHHRFSPSLCVSPGRSLTRLSLCAVGFCTNPITTTTGTSD